MCVTPPPSGPRTWPVLWLWWHPATSAGLGLAAAFVAVVRLGDVDGWSSLGVVLGSVVVSLAFLVRAARLESAEPKSRTALVLDPLFESWKLWLVVACVGFGAMFFTWNWPWSSLEPCTATDLRTADPHSTCVARLSDSGRLRTVQVGDGRRVIIDPPYFSEATVVYRPAEVSPFRWWHRGWAAWLFALMAVGGLVVAGFVRMAAAHGDTRERLLAMEQTERDRRAGDARGDGRGWRRR